MATAMNMLNIPFKECFTVNTAWEVRPASAGGQGCVATIYGKVRPGKRAALIGLSSKVR
jgi:hypothetical protein